MRIVSLTFYLADKPTPEPIEVTKQVSSITNTNIRSIIARFIMWNLVKQAKISLVCKNATGTVRLFFDFTFYSTR